MAGPRRWVFPLVTLSLSLFILGVAELALRAAWPAYRIPLFVETPVGGGKYVVANPRIAARWFTREARPPAPNPELLRRQKPARGFRVFVLGESAAQGFPWPRSGSFPRALTPMLRDALPHDTVEVITLGIAATNSFSMLDIADEVLARSPDAIVYYGGHNEYYGAYGAGSTINLPGGGGLTRVVLQLQRFALVRVMSLSIAKLQGSGPAAPDDVSFMGTVAGDRAIALDGSVFARGVAQYEDNLRRIVRRFRAAGVPVYLASVASNERDMPPFVAPKNAAARARYAAAVAALDAGDSAAARSGFSASRDLDVIRFRAPSAFVQVAKAVAESEGATYVPVAEAFAASAPAGIPGATLFTEHVHPTAAGNLLIAKQVLAAMSRVSPGRALDTTRLRPDAVYDVERALTVLDARIVAHRVEALVGRWPFVATDAQRDYFGEYRPANGLDSAAFFVAAGAKPWEITKLEWGQRRAAAGDIDGALEEFRGVQLDLPEFPIPWRLAGLALARAGREAEADEMLARADALEPSATLARIRGDLAARGGRWADAVDFYGKATRRAPADRELVYLQSVAQAMTGDTVAARETARRLLQMGPQSERQRAWVRALLRGRDDL